MPDLGLKRALKTTAYQMTEGAKGKLQLAGHGAGGTDIRLVVGGLTPERRLEVPFLIVGDSRDVVAVRL